MGTTKTAKRTTDWSIQPRGVVETTAQGSLALAALATVGDLVALDPIWGGVVTGAGALATVLIGAHHNTGPAGLTYRLGCWIGAGSWLTYGLAVTPWSVNAWAALGCGAVVAGILAPLARTKRTPGKALVLRQSARAGMDWEQRIQRVCRISVTVTAIRTWPNGTGYDVQVDLPGGNVTRKQLASFAEALATDARLPEGCGVEVLGLKGGNRGVAVLRVSTVNRLAEIIGYPEDYTPSSVLKALLFGEHSNSDAAGAEVREESMLIAGKRGSGKTTLLQDISVALGRCIDNLTWHLDLNGGGLTQPWVDVWLDGQVKRCPIDWAASNLPEGKLMLIAAIAIAKHRKASYRKLKRAHNTNLLPVSAELPQITIIVDEGAQAVKDRELAELLGELQNIGRNEACNVIVSALRPTSDLVPVNMRKQSGARIQMHGPDDEELNHMFGWKHNTLTMDQLAGKGTGFISFDGTPPRPFRAYNVLPAQIEQAALVIAGSRPDLDAASADAAGTAYATRYERMRAAFTDLGTDDESESYDLPVPMPARPLTLVRGGADSWADPRDIASPRPAPSAADWPAPVRKRPALHAEQVREVEGLPVPKFLTYALDAFKDDHRMHSVALARALDVTQADLASLLGGLGVSSLPNPFERNGEKLRGYARQHLEDAAEAIRRGELDVPPEVADWPAA